MKLPRRQFLHLAAGAGALPALSRIARAQAYPTRPVRIIVGSALCRADWQMRRMRLPAGHQSSSRQTSNWNEMAVAMTFHKFRSANPRSPMSESGQATTTPRPPLCQLPPAADKRLGYVGCLRRLDARATLRTRRDLHPCTDAEGTNRKIALLLLRRLRQASDRNSERACIRATLVDLAHVYRVPRARAPLALGKTARGPFARVPRWAV